MKAYTDIEQSKKLAEILPLDTADMSYQHFIPDVYIPQLYEQDEEDDIPAWSLSALLEILPNNEVTSTTVTRGGWDIKSAKYLDIWFAEYETEKHDNDFSLSADNPVDACYGMILKLHELNKKK